MKIECLRRRPNGTVVTIGTETYHFKPEEEGKDGPHVAPVTIKAHLARFLDIKEGYRRLPGEKPVKDDTPAQGNTPSGNDGSTNTNTDPDAGNAGNQKTAGSGEGNGDDGTDGNKQPVELTEGMDDGILRAIFEKEVGRKPSPKAKPDTMIAQIVAAREAAE